MMNPQPQPTLARLAFGAFVAAACLASTVGAQGSPNQVSVTSPKAAAIDVPKISYSRFVLANGLVVIANEDHSSPVVAIQLAYRVGSKNELPGKRGLAHFFEHMMFEGSAHVESGEHEKTIQDAGGTATAWTNEDRTWYPSTVPAHMLETALWLEAERMAFLPARLDSTRFERQREAVLNEYAQTYLASPAGGNLAGEAMVGGLFPESHPYHATSIGVADEVRKMTVADLRAFFNRYYVPNNAILTVVGDFKTSELRAMVQKQFGAIPRKGAVARALVPRATLTAEKRLVLEDRVANTQSLWVGWMGVPATHPDRMALVALSGILSGSPNSRLQRALIVERPLATQLPFMNAHFDMTDAGIFQVAAIGRANQPMTDIETVLDSVVGVVRTNGVTEAELKRWRAGFIVSRLNDLLLAERKADLLNQGEFYMGNPVGQLADIEAANRLTPADVQRVARKYLGAGRVVMSIVPAGKLTMISKPDAPYVNVTKPKAP